MKKIVKYIFIFTAALMMLSCSEDYLETAPSSSVSSSLIFESTNNAYVALHGIYRFMYAYNVSGFGGHSGFGHMANMLTSDLMGHDMNLHSRGYGWFSYDFNYSDIESADSRCTHRTWYNYYDVINNANIIIKYIDDASGLQSEKDDIKGQALALRAFSYFYLIQWYQQTYQGNTSAPGVPLYTEPTSEGKGRGTVQEVYTQITSDLTDAIALLQSAPARPTKSMIDLSVAQGLYARVALVMGDYATAETMAANARAGYTLNTPAQVTPDAYNTVDNQEWMWGARIVNEQATIFASFMSHMDARTLSYAMLGLQKEISEDLYSQISATDARLALWQAPTGTDANSPIVDYCQVKFGLKDPGNSWDADYVYMRAAEMVLIEAEAQARQAGREADAQATLYELVSQRDPSYTQSTNTGQALIDEILLHRRIELWGEGVAGVLDLNRLGEDVDRVGANFDIGLARYLNIPAGNPNRILLIPTEEIDANKALGAQDQNPTI